MKIINHGIVVPFDCNNCKCEFVVGIRSINDTGGNFYAECPECGCSCHTDYARIPNDMGKRIADYLNNQSRSSDKA